MDQTKASEKQFQEEGSGFPEEKPKVTSTEKIVDQQPEEEEDENEDDLMEEKSEESAEKKKGVEVGRESDDD